MTKTKKELQESLLNLCTDRGSDGSIRAAEQILEGNPDLWNNKIRKAIRREKFERGLYELSQVWHGDHAGKELSSLSREDLLHLLGIISRTQYAMKKKASYFVAIHKEAMKLRQKEIEACLRAYAEEGEKFAFEPEHGAWYYREIPTEYVLGWDYDKLATPFILNLWRLPVSRIEIATRLYVAFDRQQVLAQIKKRSEIAQAKKGHYYDKRLYEGAAGKYLGKRLFLKISLADGREELVNPHSNSSYEALAKRCGTYYDADGGFLFAVSLMASNSKEPILRATEKRRFPTAAEMKRRIGAVFA